MPSVDTSAQCIVLCCFMVLPIPFFWSCVNCGDISDIAASRAFQSSLSEADPGQPIFRHGVDASFEYFLSSSQRQRGSQVADRIAFHSHRAATPPKGRGTPRGRRSFVQRPPTERVWSISSHGGSIEGCSQSGRTWFGGSSTSIQKSWRALACWHSPACLCSKWEVSWRQALQLLILQSGCPNGDPWKGKWLVLLCWRSRWKRFRPWLGLWGLWSSQWDWWIYGQSCESYGSSFYSGEGRERHVWWRRTSTGTWCSRQNPCQDKWLCGQHHLVYERWSSVPLREGRIPRCWGPSRSRWDNTEHHAEREAITWGDCVYHFKAWARLWGLAWDWKAIQAEFLWMSSWSPDPSFRYSRLRAVRNPLGRNSQQQAEEWLGGQGWPQWTPAAAEDASEEELSCPRMKLEECVKCNAYLIVMIPIVEYFRQI